MIVCGNFEMELRINYLESSRPPSGCLCTSPELQLLVADDFVKGKQTVPRPSETCLKQLQHTRANMYGIL